MTETCLNREGIQSTHDGNKLKGRGFQSTHGETWGGYSVNTWRKHVSNREGIQSNTYEQQVKGEEGVFSQHMTETCLVNTCQQVKGYSVSENSLSLIQSTHDGNKPLIGRGYSVNTLRKHV